MEKYFVPLPEAIELKKLGFKEPCFSYYSGANKKVFYCVDPDDLTLEWVNHSQYDFNNFQHVFRTSAPLYAQVFEWFRDNYNIFIKPCQEKRFQPPISYSFLIEYGEENIRKNSVIIYELAELACLQKLIQLAKNGQ